MRTDTINITAYSRDTNSEIKQICNGYTPLKKRTYSKACSLSPNFSTTDISFGVSPLHYEVLVSILTGIYAKVPNNLNVKTENKLFNNLRNTILDLSSRVNQITSYNRLLKRLYTIKFNTLRRTEIFEKGSFTGTLSCPQCLSSL